MFLEGLEQDVLGSLCFHRRIEMSLFNGRVHRKRVGNFLECGLFVLRRPITELLELLEQGLHLAVLFLEHLDRVFAVAFHWWSPSDRSIHSILYTRRHLAAAEQAKVAHLYVRPTYFHGILHRPCQGELDATSVRPSERRAFTRT